MMNKQPSPEDWVFNDELNPKNLTEDIYI